MLILPLPLCPYTIVDALWKHSLRVKVIKLAVMHPCFESRARFGASPCPGEGELKNRHKAVCDWPTAVALPTLLEWIKAPANDTAKMNALRGIVRLLIPGQETNENLCGQYAALMAQAASANEKKLILSGLANIGSVCALNMVVEQVADEAVKAEAVAAAIAIAEKLGNSPQERDALKSARELIPELGRNRKK